MITAGATHVAVATDHVIESFRNETVARLQDRRGHRSRPAGAVSAARRRPLRGWASPSGRWWSSRRTMRWRRRPRWPRGDPRVERVFICTPDKDLAQCVTGRRVVQFDRRSADDSRRGGRRRQVRRQAGVDSRLPGAGGRLRPMAFPGCRAGARSRRRPCSRSSDISRRFPTTSGRGA